MAVSVETKSGFQVGTPQKLFTGEQVQAVLYATGYDVSADGQRFVVAQTVGGGTAGGTTITVVENWWKEFKK